MTLGQWRNQDFISEGSKLWKRAPTNAERVSKKPNRPLQSKSGPLQSQSGSSKARAGPTKARAGPCKARAGPSKARAGPSKARAGPSKARAGPSKAERAPRKAERPLKKPERHLQNHSGPLQIFRRGQLTPLTPPPLVAPLPWVLQPGALVAAVKPLWPLTERCRIENELLPAAHGSSELAAKCHITLSPAPCTRRTPGFRWSAGQR